MLSPGFKTDQKSRSEQKNKIYPVPKVSPAFRKNNISSTLSLFAACPSQILRILKKDSDDLKH